MEDRYLFRGKTIIGDWVRGLLASKDNKWYIGNKVGRPLAFEIRPESICQCTGYEGIYEKDIFRYEDEDYVIKWSEDSLSWEAVSLFTDERVSLAELNPNYIDVIGNEIDDPELLEV
mgnify:CR=1 FL=1